MTHILSQVFGIYMICAGIALLVRRGWPNKVMDEFERNSALIYVCGAIVLMGGTALVLTHNIWSGWPEIGVSLIGWAAAIEGAMLLIVPGMLFAFARTLMPQEKLFPVFGLITLAFGAALIWL